MAVAIILMAHFGETIRRLREDKLHISQAELAARIGTDAPHISRIENKQVAAVNQKTYRKLAEAFGMTVEELDKQWRGTTIAQTQGHPGLIPVINRAPAGKVMDYHEHGCDSGQGHFYIDRGGVKDPNAFAVIITGDSMEPQLHDGDYAIFIPLRNDGKTLNGGNVQIPDGHTMYVRFSGDSRHEGCTIAMLFRLTDGRVELRKRNTKYRPLVVGPEEIAQVSALAQVRQNILPGVLPEYGEFDPHAKNSNGDV